MPELPEVQTVISRLDSALRGARVSGVELLRRDIYKTGPRNLSGALSGKRIEQITRHGKRIIWNLEGGTRFNVHLGMTGSLVLHATGATLDKHTHLRIRFSGIAEEVRFSDPRRFGGIWLSKDGGRRAGGRFSAPLGPDALDIRLPEFRTLLGRKRQIKALLLDQSAIAGLGNIYTDEALFMAGIHPLERARDLDRKEAATLLGCIRRVLRAAIAAGGSTISDYVDADGNSGGYQKRHRVYGREGMQCRRCRTPIEREITASRSTHFCPRCQKRRTI